MTAVDRRGGDYDDSRRERFDARRRRTSGKEDFTMARVRLDLPDKFLFTTEIPLRVSDINYGGHLGNDAVLSPCALTAGRNRMSRAWESS